MPGLRVPSIVLSCLTLTCLLLATAHAMTPAEKYDLQFWKLTLPTDDNTDGKVDEVDVRVLSSYSHPEFF